MRSRVAIAHLQALAETLRTRYRHRRWLTTTHAAEIVQELVELRGPRATAEQAALDLDILSDEPPWGRMWENLPVAEIIDRLEVVAEDMKAGIR